MLTITCPHCCTNNRVPDTRLEEHPLCGKCGEALFSQQPHSVDADIFNRIINHNSTPVIVDFWANWCAPCKMFAPVYEQAARQLEPHMRLIKLDTEAYPQIASFYRIQSIPTLALFREGKEIARQSGTMSLASMLDWLNIHQSD